MQPGLHPRKRAGLPWVLVLGLGLVACGNSSVADAESNRVVPTPAGAKAIEVTAPGATEAAHPVRIAQGEPIKLSDHLVSGEFTVFDFMSDFCPPCRQIAPWMDRLHAERADVSVVKVDINRPGRRGIDWGSPVAQQFGLRSIPHFKIYDPQGALLAEGDQAWQMLTGWFEQLPEQARG